MDEKERAFLKEKSRRIRYLTIDCIGKLGFGHVGGSLSVAEVLSVLYYKVMNINPELPEMEGRDRFVLSKGHAGPALYAVLADRGYFDLCWLDTLNKPETRLPSHVDMTKTPGIDMTTGSLGQGISCAVGMAKASKLKKDGAYIYCLIGDGESQEGQVWEAAIASSHFKLNNLIVFTDWNKYQIDGALQEIMAMDELEKKWKAFGWNVQTVNGHDEELIYNAIENAKSCANSPSMIILDTIKGKGVSFIEEARDKNHHMSISEEERCQALSELE